MQQRVSFCPWSDQLSSNVFSFTHGAIRTMNFDEHLTGFYPFPFPVSSYALNHRQAMKDKTRHCYSLSHSVSHRESTQICGCVLVLSGCSKGHEHRKISVHIVSEITLFGKHVPDSWLFLCYCYLLNELFSMKSTQLFSYCQK